MLHADDDAVTALARLADFDEAGKRHAGDRILQHRVGFAYSRPGGLIAMIANGGAAMAMRGLRMRWLAIAVTLPAVLLLAACSTDVGPSAAELEARWNAQNVVPPNYKQDLLAFLRS